MRVPSICRWWFKVGEVGRKAGRGEVQCDLQGSPLIISGVKLEPRSSEETIVILMGRPEPHEPIEKPNKSLECYRATTTSCYHTVALVVASLPRVFRLTVLHVWNSRFIPYPKFNLNYSIPSRSSVILFPNNDPPKQGPFMNIPALRMYRPCQIKSRGGT